MGTSTVGDQGVRRPAPRPPPTLRLFDGFSLHHAGLPIHLPLSGQRLVAYLGLHERPTRGLIAGTLWPEVTEEHALGSLRSTIWRVQRGRADLLQSHDGVLALAAGVAVDVRAFVASAEHVLQSPDGLEVRGLPVLARSSDLLPGWYDDWVLAARERLRQQRVIALEAVAQRLWSTGDHARALEAALAATRAEPLRESAHRLVIRIHLAAGNAADALNQFRRYRDLLDVELGIAPSSHIMRLIQGLADRLPV